MIDLLIYMATFKSDLNLSKFPIMLLFLRLRKSCAELIKELFNFYKESIEQKKNNVIDVNFKEGQMFKIKYIILNQIKENMLTICDFSVQLIEKVDEKVQLEEFSLNSEIAYRKWNISRILEKVDFEMLELLIIDKNIQKTNIFQDIFSILTKSFFSIIQKLIFFIDESIFIRHLKRISIVFEKTDSKNIVKVEIDKMLENLSKLLLVKKILSNIKYDINLLESDQNFDFNIFLKNICEYEEFELENSIKVLFDDHFSKILSEGLLTILRKKFTNENKEIIKTIANIFYLSMEKGNHIFTNKIIHINRLISAEIDESLKKQIDLYEIGFLFFPSDLKKDYNLSLILGFPNLNYKIGQNFAEEIKEHRSFLCNQEFSILPEIYAEENWNFSRFSRLIFKDFPNFFKIISNVQSIEDYCNLNQKRVFEIDFISCSKLFNFVVGFIWVFEKGIPSKNRSELDIQKIKRMLSCNLDVLVRVLLIKFKQIDKFKASKNLQVEINNPFLIESLLRIISLGKKKTFISEATFNRVEEIFDKHSNIFDFEVFCCFFIEFQTLIGKNSEIFLILQIFIKNAILSSNNRVFEIIFRKQPIIKSIIHEDKFSLEYFFYDYSKNMCNSFWEYLITISEKQNSSEPLAIKGSIIQIFEHGSTDQFTFIYSFFTSKFESILNKAIKEEVLNSLLNILKILNVSLSICHFKSFCLSKKLTEIVLKINNFVQKDVNQNFIQKSIDLKIEVYQILLKLCDVKIGIRAFFEDLKNEKSLYEDIPIEIHILEIIKLISNDSLVSFPHFEIQMYRLVLLKMILSNYVGSNLVLQLIEKQKIKFDFYRILDEFEKLIDNAVFKEKLAIYGAEFLKMIINIFPIKSVDQFKLILSLFDQNLDIFQKKDEKEVLLFLDEKLKMIIEKLEKDISFKKSFYVQIIIKLIKAIKKEIFEQKTFLKDLFKKSKLFAKDLMPDTISDRISLISKFPKNKGDLSLFVTPLFKNLDMQQITSLILKINTKTQMKKSFYVPKKSLFEEKLNNSLEKRSNVLTFDKISNFFKKFENMFDFCFLFKNSIKQEIFINSKIIASSKVLILVEFKTQKEHIQKEEPKNVQENKIELFSQISESKFNPPNPFLNERVFGQANSKQLSQTQTSSNFLLGRINSSNIQILKNQIINARQKTDNIQEKKSNDPIEGPSLGKREFYQEVQNDQNLNRYRQNESVSTQNHPQYSYSDPMNKAQAHGSYPSPNYYNRIKTETTMSHSNNEPNDLINLLKTEPSVINPPNQINQAYIQGYPEKYYNINQVNNPAIHPFHYYQTGQFYEANRVNNALNPRLNQQSLKDDYPGEYEFYEQQGGHSQNVKNMKRHNQYNHNRRDNAHTGYSHSVTRIEGEFSDEESKTDKVHEKIEKEEQNEDQNLDSKNHEFLSLVGKLRENKKF